MAPRWLPLESNPDVINKYLVKLGVPARWQCCDVYGLDEGLLMMVPQPICALLLLFPITDNYEKFRAEEEANLTANPQAISENIYFTKQTVGNACGTVGMIHSIANNTDKIDLSTDGPLKAFIDATKGLPADEKAKKLETDDGIGNCHAAAGLEGQTEAPSVDEKVNLHFIAFVEKDGCIYELDGRKPFPINHGASSSDTLLQDAARVCKQFMDRDPTQLQFNMIAITSPME